MRILSITTAIFIVLASWIPSTLAPGPPRYPNPAIVEKPNPNT